MRLHLLALARVAAAALLAAALLAGTAAAASAHVTVHPDATQPGGYAQLTFRVPTESAAASTTELTVTLPQDTPLASVSVKPVPGWTVHIKTDTLPTPVTQPGGATLTKAPHRVTWKATSAAAAIKPGQYQEFSLSAGPLPDGGTLTFPATQYYSDGTSVAWDQHATGTAEPDHPAPAFTLTDDGPATAAAAGPAVSAASTSSTRAGTDSTSRWLSGSALVVALIAAVLGGTALARNRRRATSPGATDDTATRQGPA